MIVILREGLSEHRKSLSYVFIKNNVKTFYMLYSFRENVIELRS